MSDNYMSGFINALKHKNGYIQGDDGYKYFFFLNELMEDGIHVGTYVDFVPGITPKGPNAYQIYHHRDYSPVRKNKAASPKSTHQPATPERAPPSPKAQEPELQVRVMIHKAVGLAARDPTGFSDPFCAVSLGDQKRNTKVIPRTLNPVWNEEFVFPIRENVKVLHISLWDSDRRAANDPLGKCSLSASGMRAGDSKTVTLPVVLNKDQGIPAPHGTLDVTLAVEPYVPEKPATPPPAKSASATVSPRAAAKPSPATVAPRYVNATYSPTFLMRTPPPHYVVSPVPDLLTWNGLKPGDRVPLFKEPAHAASHGYRYIACHDPYTSTEVHPTPLRNTQYGGLKLTTYNVPVSKALLELHTETFFDPLHVACSHDVNPISVMKTAENL